MSSEFLPIDEAKARAIELVILDVDGVLTDGGIYVGATQAGEPVEMKRFHVEDGLGVKFLGKAGLRVAVVSGRVSEATNLRAMEIGVHQIHQDPGAHKLPIVLRIMSEMGVEWDAVAMLGDDLADLPVLERAGLPCTVANGVAEVRQVCAWQARRTGGQGAVREFTEALLRARGQWDALVEEYKLERGA
ncbi:MAG: HAD hydrolase family protein [Gemmatimonadetes bacterium]|nr:HAD hydrolase family protein [Gemmatimonadota bacterium]